MLKCESFYLIFMHSFISRIPDGATLFVVSNIKNQFAIEFIHIYNSFNRMITIEKYFSL